MQSGAKHQKVAIPLRGQCDGCDRRVDAMLSVWLTADGKWAAPTLSLQYDEMITSVYGQDEFGQWHEIVFHWEAFTDAEREQHMLDLYWDIDKFREMGLCTQNEMLQSLRNHAEAVLRDIRKTTCGEFVFFDRVGNRLDFSYIVAIGDAADCTEALAELMQEAP